MVTYSEVTVSGYNSSPPTDDGAETETNKVKWDTIKTKLNDPVKTALDSTQTNISAAVSSLNSAIVSNDSDITSIQSDVSSLQTATTAANLLTAIQTVDGAGSGLDADLLDGSSSAAFCQVANNLSDVTAATAFNNIKQAATSSATGVVELAVASEMVTGTDTGRVPSVSTVVNHEGVSKAWGMISNNGGSAGIVDHYNVASVNRDGEGVITVTLNVTMANDDFAVVATPDVEAGVPDGSVTRLSINAKTTTTFQVFTADSDNNARDGGFSFMVLGTLA